MNLRKEIARELRQRGESFTTPELDHLVAAAEEAQRAAFDAWTTHAMPKRLRVIRMVLSRKAGKR